MCHVGTLLYCVPWGKGGPKLSVPHIYVNIMYEAKWLGFQSVSFIERFFCFGLIQSVPSGCKVNSRHVAKCD